MKPERFSSGNDDDLGHGPTGNGASMKPERFSSGNFLEISVSSIRERFNEAGAFQLRKHRVLWKWRPQLVSFNEAGAFQLRKPETPRSFVTPEFRFNEAGAFQLRKLHLESLTTPGN